MTADQLRTALKACDLSQRRLAEVLGVDATTVNRWVLGKLEVPKYASAYLELLETKEKNNGAR